MTPTRPTTPRRSHAERTEATTAALLDAGRELFAADGFAATSLDAVVARAGVTKGALYHHFSSKQELFRAVYEREQRRLAREVAAAYETKADPWEAFEAGCRAFLEASLDPGIQRIVLLDSPSALGWEAMRAGEADSQRLMQEGVRLAMEAGILPRRKVEPLAHLLFGAICEAAMVIARAEDQRATLRGVLAELRTLLSALATDRA